jgi:ParB family chromosome partitioning protein
MSNPKSKLGRGLDNLLSPAPQEQITGQESQAGTPLMVAVTMLDKNPDQPRRDFNDTDLQALAQSIIAQGVIEPLVVTQKPDGRYELVAGERRHKAAIRAGLDEVPVIISKNNKNEDRLIKAIMENICREDLNPIEQAEAFQRLEKEFIKTHQEIATMLGWERSTITNSIRLLKLPENIRDDIRYERLTPGHGRAILSLVDHDKLPDLRREVIERKLNVRQTELLVKKWNQNKKNNLPNSEKGDEDYFESLARAFTEKLGGLKVRINHLGQNRKMEIYYSTNEDLERLMAKIGVEAV